MADEKAGASTSTEFSWLRTRLSVERTLMSWIRTGTALIGFGFTIFQFLERLENMPGVAAARSEHTARVVALAMIGIGVIGVGTAVIQYRGVLRHLHEPRYEAFATSHTMRSGAMYAAVLLVIVGIIAFGAVLTRTT
jgi:putative membrane protein